MDDLRRGLGDWQREFLIAADMNAFKKKFNEQLITVELTKFLKLEAKIDDLKQTCDAFVTASNVLNQF